MARYIVKRFLLMIPTMIGVAALIFFLMRVVPGDIVELRMSGESGFASKEQIALERARFGLDRPLWRQFVEWMWGLARFDFGRSMWTGASIGSEIQLRFLLSLELAILATSVAVLLAIPLGVIAALKQDTWVDYAVRIFSIAGIATPSFWLGIVVILALLIVFVAAADGVHAAVGQPVAEPRPAHLAGACRGLSVLAVATRMTRSAMLEVLREDYIRTARAKGLWEKLILTRHALKNAMLPVLTVVGLEFAFLMGGLVVTEQVFNLNGLGLLFVQSVAHRDYTLTQALVLLVAAIFIVVNFLMDLMYAWLDLRSGTRSMAINPAIDVASEAPTAEPGSRWVSTLLTFCRRRPLGAIGAGIVVIMLLVAAFAPFLAPYDPVTVDFGAMLSPPGAKHWLGTDAFGRDVLSRLIYGSRTALLVGFGSALLGPPRARCSAWEARTSAARSTSICSASWTCCSASP
jgi:peptide/nickel transport system permease protein